jgi:solute:Na+ symporter, SSS family
LKSPHLHDKFSLGSFGLSLTESTFWIVFIYGIFINLQNYGIDQNYIQRYMSARNEKEAISSAFGGGTALYPCIPALFHDRHRIVCLLPGLSRFAAK